MDNLRAELQQSQNAELEEGKRAISAAARASYMSVDSLDAEVLCTQSLLVVSKSSQHLYSQRK